MLAYLGLGSNVGDKEESLRSAVDALDAHVCLRVRETSPVYRTAPQYVEDQDWFLNAVVAVESLLDPPALLTAVKDLEIELGRVPRRRYGPREIDIDLLVCPGLAIDTPELILPHPRIAERAFVLRPLADLAPDLPVNGRGDTAASLSSLLEGKNPSHAGSAGMELYPAAPLTPRAGIWHDRVTCSPGETERVGALLAGGCAGGEVFALCGNLGAGKTCLARGFARGLHIQQPIQSPTFTLCRTYAEGRLSLYHWDFYRLGDSEEVEAAGFDDSIDDPNGTTLVEWADRVPDLWTFPHVKVWMSVVDDESRALAVRFPQPVVPGPGEAFLGADETKHLEERGKKGTQEGAKNAKNAKGEKGAF